MKTLGTLRNDKLSLELLLSDDRVKLFLRGESKDRGVTLTDIYALTNQYVPAERLDRAVLDDVVRHLNAGEKVADRRIAKGTEPEPGESGKLVWLVRRRSERPSVAIDARGFADFKHPHWFDNVKPGHVLARLYHPEPGKDGCDALGKPIKASGGKPYKVRCGEGAELRQAEHGFDTIVATVAGVADEARDVITVVDTLVVPGALDLKIGAIDFVGNVIIEGDVNPDLGVRAEGVLEVRGDVHAGAVLRGGKGVMVKGSMRGGTNGGEIVSGADVSLALCYEIKIHAAGMISLSKEAIECALSTKAAVVAPDARIVGGLVLTALGLECRELGSVGGTHTAVQLTSGTEASSEFQALATQLARVSQAIVLLSAHLGPLVENPKALERLDAAHREKIVPQLENFKLLQAKKIEIKAAQKRLVEAAAEMPHGRIVVHETLWPGCEIRAGTERLKIHESHRGPLAIEMSEATQKLEIGPPKPLDLPRPAGIDGRGEKNKKNY